MGVCLSCLRPELEDDEYNERTSLLGQQNRFSDENIQEELFKQQQRQSELNGIVNELSDNLIDVSTFLSLNTTINQSVGNITETGEETVDDENETGTLSKRAKSKILEDVENLDNGVKESCKVELTGPLFLEFK